MGGLDDARVLLRAARPSVEDALVFARLFDEAQEGKYRRILGRGWDRMVAHAFLCPDNELAHEYATFAEVDGAVVGMGSGYTSADLARFTGEPLETAAGGRRYRLVVVRRLGRRVSRFMNTVFDGDFYVRAIAVDEAHRGRGIGTTILRSLEETALRSGSKRLTLDVYAKNRDARRLYERFGMMAGSESRKWFGIPDTNLIRMVKPLEHPTRDSDSE